MIFYINFIKYSRKHKILWKTNPKLQTKHLMPLTWKPVKNITGVHAEKVKISHFAMDRTNQLNLAHCHSRQKKQGKRIFVVANTAKIHLTATALTEHYNSLYKLLIVV